LKPSVINFELLIIALYSFQSSSCEILASWFDIIAGIIAVAVSLLTQKNVNRNNTARLKSAD